MNLVKDCWLPVVRRNGAREEIAIHQLLNQYDENPVMDIEAPRPDFRNALYQLLIGIIQVAAMPNSEEEWGELFYKPYEADDFSGRLLKLQHCFEIDSDGPAFMQDYDLIDGEKKSVSSLLIEAPGNKTIKDNHDHFIKRDNVISMDSYWAAIALYTLQTFAPAGGVGHRVGLRGGGPLTTMVILKRKTTLWKTLWLNAISKEYISLLGGNPSLSAYADIFPWMKASKLSSKKGNELFAEEVHPFHQFFGMPRRIRLSFNGKGLCSLTGALTNSTVSFYKTKNYGNNYDGVWKHPLNAYNLNSEELEKFPLSIKAQPGGVGYRYWTGLVIPSIKTKPATVVKILQESVYRKEIMKKRDVRLWAAGFDMDNMKARCWYEAKLPVYEIENSYQKLIADLVENLIEQAAKLSVNIRSSLKTAWYSSPKDHKGDMSFIDISFWQNTEAAFYDILNRLIDNIKNDKYISDLVDEWSIIIAGQAVKLFEQHALAQQEDGLDMKRVVKAQKGLTIGIDKMKKVFKALKDELED
jgi:CRISPR system Cascade subunit CasA